MNDNFETLKTTLQDSIFTWDYFTDFEKVKTNVKKIEKELPNSFAELSDYPLRSALGDFFYTLKEKVKGEHFENYFEF